MSSNSIVSRSIKRLPARSISLKAAWRPQSYYDVEGRGTRARELLGWKPQRTSVLDWIRHDMMRAALPV